MLRIILAGIAAFSVIDYLATTRAIAYGIAEANPAKDVIIHTPLFPAIKLLIIPAALYWAWSVRDKWQHNRVLLAGLLGLFAVYGTLAAWHVWGSGVSVAKGFLCQTNPQST